MNQHEDKLVIKAIRQLYKACGLKFIRRDLQEVIKPILMSAGRHDLNTGSWISRDGSRPFQLRSSASGPAKETDEMILTGRWIEIAGLSEQMMSDAQDEDDEWAMREWDMPFDEYVDDRMGRSD